MTDTLDNNTLKKNSFTQEQLQRLQPVHFLKSCLNSNLRPDGRSILDSRSMKFDLGSIGSAHGSALVSIGNTSVSCGIKFEIAEPEITKPNQGFIIPNVELGPMCSPKFRSGPPNDESQILSNRLRDILISSEFLSLGSLVIHPGKSVWVVYVDIICISYDGNVFDSIIFSAMLALKHARIPRVKFDLDRNRVVPEDTKSPHSTIPLCIKSSLYSTSFVIFNETILPDPTLFEEELATGFLTIVMDENTKIRQIWYSNGGNTNHQMNKTIGNNQQQPTSFSYLPLLDFCFQYSKKKMLSQNKNFDT